MQRVLRTLTTNGVQDAYERLQQLVRHHHRWVERVSDTLFGDALIPVDDLAHDAHRRCPLGAWLEQTDLAEGPEAGGVREAHRRMHDHARRLLLAAARGERVLLEDYGGLVRTIHAFRGALMNLESGLKSSLDRASLLTARIFESAGEAVIITDAQGRIVDVNRTFTRVTGYAAEEVLGLNPSLLKSGRHSHAFYQRMYRTLAQDGYWQGEIWNRRKNGEVYPELLTISAVQDGGQVTNYVAMFSDITVAKRNEERLVRLAHYDPLTGLPNRSLFTERLRQALAWAERHRRSAAVMFLDLDRFKLINDTLGHNVGDALLVEAASRLQTCVRRTDTVARLGGDEFTIVLNELAGRDGAIAVARKVLDVMAVPFVLQGQEVFVTTSIGICLYPEGGTTPDALIKAADMAMYAAKHQGGNNFQFFRSADHSMGEQFVLENGLRRALERHELELHYQPRVDIEARRIVGLEALLRWRHPQRGLLPPAQFIPLAEETGLITPIGEWVLREACRQAREWQDAGIEPVKVSVNVSPRQLRCLDLAERVARALDDAGLAPEWLDLELTETAVLQNMEEAAGVLRQIASLGVSISIDDFGSGYTSLSYLKRFPISTVKIDRSFIAGVLDNLDDQAISRGIIALADSLGLRVVAEGVEKKEQLDLLRDYHCCDAQGFLFSRPVPPTEVAGLFTLPALGLSAAAAAACRATSILGEHGR